MKILSTLFLGSLMLLGGCQPREAGRTAPEPQPEQQTETPAEQVEETPAPAPLPSPTGSMVGINATNQGYAMIPAVEQGKPGVQPGLRHLSGRRQYPDGSQHRLFRQLRGSDLRGRLPDGSRDRNRL